MSGENKTFCILPWNHLSINSDGSIRTCTFSNRTIKKNNGENFNFGHDSVDDIINSDEFKDIRRKMLKGEKVSGCERCYEHEENGNNSYRQFWQTVFSSVDNPTEIQNIEELAYLDIKFGNMCNLKCRMCSPLLSSELNKEVKQIRITNPEIVNLSLTPIEEDTNDWYELAQFNTSIEKIAPYLNHIYITGGEPTIIKKYYWLLEYLIEHGYNNNIVIRLSSNLTNVSTNMLNLIKQFKRIQYMTSLDGFGKVNEYIRAPSKWSQLDNNLRKILNLDLPNIIVTNTIAITPLNLENQIELYSYLNSFNKDAGKAIINVFPAVVDQASHYDIRYLPLDFRKKCWEKIENWMNSEEVFFDKRFFDGMDRLKSRCLVDGYNENKLKDLRDVTMLLDNHRGVNLENVSPELAEILKAIE